MHVSNKIIRRSSVGVVITTLLVSAIMTACGPVSWCRGPGWRVCASKSASHVWVYHDGTLMRDSYARFGGANADGVFETQEGIFEMWPSYGGPNEVSHVWHDAPMPWATYFGSQGQATHYSSETGPTEFSHGCIRIAIYEVAQFIWTIERNQVWYHTPGATIFIYK